MAVAALKLKPKLKMFHATMHVTRAEEWCVEAEIRRRGARAVRRRAGSPVPSSAIGCIPNLTACKTISGHANRLQRLNPTIADAILDRLVHNAHRLTLKGESMRKTAAKRAGLDLKQAA